MSIMGIVKAGQSLADVAAVASFLAAVVADQWASVGAAVVSVGAIIIPRCIDWYRAIQEAKREQHRLDVATDTELIATEVRRRVELEEEVNRLKTSLVDLHEKLENFACPFANADGARCEPGKPGEWLKDVKT